MQFLPLITNALKALTFRSTKRGHHPESESERETNVLIQFKINKNEIRLFPDFVFDISGQRRRKKHISQTHSLNRFMTFDFKRLATVINHKSYLFDMCVC